MTVQEALQWAREQLEESDSPHLDAEVLLREASGHNSAQQIAHADQILDEQTKATYRGLVAERRTGTPIAYLLGLREFYSLALVVSPDVLIPRPETELLVDMALHLIPKDQHRQVLDLGTGSGAIAICLAKHRPQAQVDAVDCSSGALRIAQQNAISHHAESIQFFQGSWFEALPKPKQYDLIVSNPPYINATDPHLQQGDVRFEPQSALIADNKGLADYQIIIPQAEAFLLPGAHILFEIGCDQEPQITTLLAQAGYIEIHCHQDLAGKDRLIAATRP